MTTPPSSDALWREYQRTREPRLRDRLVLTYAPLVKLTATRMRARAACHVDDEDLVSCGLEGLLRAVDRFQPGRGIPFEGFALRHIRGRILDELRRLDWVPRSVRGRARAIARAQARFECERRAVADAELAAALGLTVEELRDSLAEIARAPLVPLDALDGDGSLAIADTLEDAQAERPEDAACRAELHAELSAAMRSLRPREAQVLRLHYFHGLTLREIGGRFRASEQRVSQIHMRALLKLRARLDPVAGPVGGSPWGQAERNPAR